MDTVRVPSALVRAAGVAAWAAAARAYLHVETGEDEVHHAVTDDGWRLALSRYRPRGTARGHPVVLCHGLAANRVPFDLAPGADLARHLSRRGFDVWALELRGHGRSDRPRPFTPRRYGWSFDDYLLRDVPAALRCVRRETGRPAAHWIGHSMGGALLYAHLACGGSATIRSGTTLGSALDYSATPSGFHTLARIRGLTRVLPAVPFGPLALLGAPLMGHVANPVEEFNCWPTNVDPGLVRRLHAQTFHSVSSPVLAQLSTALEPGGLRSHDGAVRYLDGLARATAPVLALSGDRDRQCAPAAVARTLEALGAAHGPSAPARRLLPFGKAHGHADHYGHFDFLIGRRATTEVYPHLEAWLAEHD